MKSQLNLSKLALVLALTTLPFMAQAADVSVKLHEGASQQNVGDNAYVTTTIGVAAPGQSQINVDLNSLDVRNSGRNAMVNTAIGVTGATGPQNSSYTSNDMIDVRANNIRVENSGDDAMVLTAIGVTGSNANDITDDRARYSNQISVKAGNIQHVNSANRAVSHLEIGTVR